MAEHGAVIGICSSRTGAEATHKDFKKAVFGMEKLSFAGKDVHPGCHMNNLAQKTLWGVFGFLLFVEALMLADSTVRAGGPYSERMPAFTLKDPTDVAHTQEQFLGKGTVAVITIPNIKHGEIQSQWYDCLLKNGWPEKGPSLVFIQDLSQSDVKEKAVSRMKEKFKPGQTPLLLLDPTGNVRRSFLIQNDETVLLVFNNEGKLVFSFDEEPSFKVAKQVKEVVSKW